MARTAGPEPQIGLRGRGTVVVTAEVPTGAAETWRALSERARLAEWLGDLSGDLVPGARVRLEFGDGDFFDIDVARATQPLLRWTWRFMGCGPAETIELRAEPSAAGSVVTVTDGNPARDREEALELGRGWQDFLTRLQRHLATGERSRYDWRSDVDVWTELPLPAADARRLVIAGAAEWLPLASGAASLLTADSVVLGDGEEPATFALGEVTGTGAGSVRFLLRPSGIAGALTTDIGVRERGREATLAVRQTGFRDLRADNAAQRRLRARFAAAWLTSVHAARELVERAATGSVR